MNVVVVRENEEDLYAGIEHRHTDQVSLFLKTHIVLCVQAYQCLKLITRPGCEKICNYAFEFARRNGRKKVSAFVKDNIMKMTDGLFYQVFEEVGIYFQKSVSNFHNYVFVTFRSLGARYPEIKRDKWIVDIGAARIADTPERFDVVVMANLYGDIISDITAQITGSVGLGASSNIGDDFAMFEAIHGSAPDIAGKNIANPSGLLLSSCLLLSHIGQPQLAEFVHNAWLATIEEGIHTPDIFSSSSKQKVGTKEFAEVSFIFFTRLYICKGCNFKTWSKTQNFNTCFLWRRIND